VCQQELVKHACGCDGVHRQCVRGSQEMCVSGCASGRAAAEHCQLTGLSATGSTTKLIADLAS